MYVLQLHTRRLLQETAVSLASAPLNNITSNNNDNDNGNLNQFDINTHFSPSMAIILVVLLAALFFMAFFSIYIKRCTAHSTDLRARTAPGAAPPRLPATSPASQGVDAAFLESLPLVSYKASKKKGSANVECVVCITEFAENEPLRQLPRCKHVFHKECIDMWLFSHTTCPLCRRSVLLDGSRSFRWGGSGSLRSSTGHRWGGESQRGSTAMSIDGEGTLPNEGAHANLAEIHHDALPRSHSTGHSFLKKAQSGALRPGTPTYNDEDKAEPSTGCLPITPRAAFQRSRSVAATVGDAPAQSVSGWMREAGASLKRVWSVKRVSPTAEASASSSSVGPVL